MEGIKFYRCALCGNIFEVVRDSGVNPACCGQPMTVLEANTSDGAGEKHVPAVERDGKALKVQVGAVLHPMQAEHYIEWIVVKQEDRVQRVCLKPGQEPVAEFTLDCGTAPVIVYEYCNLHGLWSAEA